MGIGCLSIDLDADPSKPLVMNRLSLSNESEGKVFTPASVILFWLEGEVQKACLPGRRHLRGCSSDSTIWLEGKNFTETVNTNLHFRKGMSKAKFLHFKLHPNMKAKRTEWFSTRKCYLSSYFCYSCLLTIPRVVPSLGRLGYDPCLFSHKPQYKCTKLI